MKVKIAEKTRVSLLAEGLYQATVMGFTPKNDKKTTAAFGLTDGGTVVTQDYPADLSEGGPLWKLVETLLGHSPGADASGGEFDLDSLTGVPCQVVIERRRTSGGKMVGAVKAILSPSKTAAV